MTKHSSLRVRAEQANPGCLFALLSVVSLVLGLVGGVWIWTSLGFGPDNSGGTTLLLCGALLTGLLAVVFGRLCRSRAVFYGLGLFTWLTILFLIVSVLFSK